MEKKKLSLKEIGPQRLIMLFLAGILLLVLSIPSFTKSQSGIKEEKTGIAQTGLKEEDKDSDYTKEMEEKLVGILGKVEGIGKVEVMITLKTSKEKVALKDSPYTEESETQEDGAGGTRKSTSITREDETVMVSDGSGQSEPYVVKETEPVVEGVLVLAQGGDDSKLISEIVGAVQVLFDVPSHKIKVMKMESGTR